MLFKEALCEGLVEAVELAYSDDTKKRGLGGMIRWLRRRSKPLTQRELVVLLRVACDSTMTSRQDGMQVVMGTCTLIQKLGHNADDLKGDWGKATKAICRSLASHYKQAAKAKVTLEQYWTSSCFKIVL